MITTIPYPLLGLIFCLTSLRFRFLPRLPVLQSILRRKTIRIQRKQQPKDRPIEDEIKLREADLLTETGFQYTFRHRYLSSKSNKREYHIIKPVDGDDGFHLHYTTTYGIRYYRNPAKVVSDYLKARNHWMEYKQHGRVQKENSASLSVSTQPPLGKTGSALP